MASWSYCFGQEAEHRAHSLTTPGPQREFQALLLTPRSEWTHLIWQSCIILKRVRKPEDRNFTEKKINSLYLAFFSAFHHLSQSLRLPVSKGNSEIMLQGGPAACPTRTAVIQWQTIQPAGESADRREAKRSTSMSLQPKTLSRDQ